MKKAILGLVGVTLLGSAGAVAQQDSNQVEMPHYIRPAALAHESYSGKKPKPKPPMSKDHRTLKQVEQNGAFEIPISYELEILGAPGAKFPVKDAVFNLHPNKNEGPKYTLRDQRAAVQVLAAADDNEILTQIKKIRDFFSDGRNLVFGTVVPKDLQVLIRIKAAGAFEEQKQLKASNVTRLPLPMGKWVLHPEAGLGFQVTLKSKSQVGGVIEETVFIPASESGSAAILGSLTQMFRKKFKDDLELGKTIQERNEILSSKIKVAWGDLSPEQRKAILESQMNTKTDKTGQSKPTNKDLNKGFDELALEQKVAKRASRLQ